MSNASRKESLSQSNFTKVKFTQQIVGDLRCFKKRSKEGVLFLFFFLVTILMDIHGLEEQMFFYLSGKLKKVVKGYSKITLVTT